MFMSSTVTTHRRLAARVVLAAGSTVPLLAWRRFPLGVFAVTAAAGVMLAGLGDPVDLLLEPS